MNSEVSFFDPKEFKAVQFTPAAIAHIKKEIQKHQAIGLRLGVNKSGCSGYKYAIDYVFEPKNNDRLIDIDPQLQVYIDSESLMFFSNVTVDYVQQGLNSQLKFINPNEKNSCGCGESFSV